VKCSKPYSSASIGRTSSGGQARRGVQSSLSPHRGSWNLFSVRRGRKCSADFQSAVSPNCIRQSVRSVAPSGVSDRLAECNSALQLRYSRVRLCATMERSIDTSLEERVNHSSAENNPDFTAFHCALRAVSSLCRRRAGAALWRAAKAGGRGSGGKQRERLAYRTVPEIC